MTSFTNLQTFSLIREVEIVEFKIFLIYLHNKLFFICNVCLFPGILDMFLF